MKKPGMPGFFSSATGSGVLARALSQARGGRAVRRRSPPYKTEHRPRSDQNSKALPKTIRSLVEFLTSIDRTSATTAAAHAFSRLPRRRAR